jgi:hypothetical protein
MPPSWKWEGPADLPPPGLALFFTHFRVQTRKVADYGKTDFDDVRNYFELQR